MFICKDCGAVFDDYKIIKDPRPYGMGVCYEEFALCPHCESDDISEATECERCGKIIAEEDCICGDDDDKDYCEECYYEVVCVEQEE